MPHELTGGCFCGAVRYRAAGVVRTSYCHCRMCQKASGAPVVAFLSVPVDGFTLTQGTMTAYRSSQKAVRHFCGTCGTQLTFRLVENPVEIDINLATLDHPERLAPADHIYTSSAMPWLRIEDGLPRHKEARPG
ncbi:MAG: GFA family protein [Alphaproteobacteria bacterium]|nr:GFA family protein [Alphaproteobacteria bacterium]